MVESHEGVYILGFTLSLCFSISFRLYPEPYPEFVEGMCFTMRSSELYLPNVILSPSLRSGQAPRRISFSEFI